jgi:LmbE family N-acetylglucosaminyl deacetylase
MAQRILCIAPHPDDETLGCGGTLLRHKSEGDEIHWAIVTEMTAASGFGTERLASRAREIEQVAAEYGFAGVHRCALPTMRLDSVPIMEVIEPLSRIIRDIAADILYVPFRGDAHSDHAVVFDAAAACTKSFRYPTVRAVYAYEVPSETGFGLKPEDPGFRPNLFVPIDGYIERKIEIMKLFEGELAPHPFPRSEASMRALALLRGSTCGAQAAEAFMVLREIRR